MKYSSIKKMYDLAWIVFLSVMLIVGGRALLTQADFPESFFLWVALGSALMIPFKLKLKEMNEGGDESFKK